MVTPSTHGVADRINEQISQNSHGRLFAVIYIGGHQFKVTTEDLLLIRTNRRFPDVGDRICIEKVLLVGGKDFTMVGRPLLNNVRVEATVVEKTLSHRKIWFYFIRRKGVKKLKLIQDFLTVIRINSIEVSEVEDDVD
ncbi:MRPL21 [Bugula neritina]|uniref:Large ribosomal subunit protein bL21m n=1 Tax=Bugula neritina TaxID=10212 RepID=A0A7J7JPE0_BUGNE|nr:MRPL21 [Bugula neritina]